MQKWEYKRMLVRFDDNLEVYLVHDEGKKYHLDKVLENMGKVGWELIIAHRWGEWHGGQGPDWEKADFFYVFKRPLMETT